MEADQDDVRTGQGDAETGQGDVETGQGDVDTGQGDVGSGQGDVGSGRGAWPDRRIGELAGRQATMVSHDQLVGLGVARRTVGAALERGRLHREHRGVYSLVAPQARPPRAPEWAAVLACGPHAVLSHRTAATLHGLPVEPSAIVELTLAGCGRGRTRSGLRVHRTTSLRRGEVIRLGGLLVTSIPRVVLDLAVELEEDPLARLVDRALTRTSRAKLTEAIDDHARWPGAARVRALLDPARPSADTWSTAETRLLELVRRADLPIPEANVRVGEYIPDLLWREQRVIVEFDSWSFHGGPRSFQRDRARHNVLETQGYHVIHVTWQQLTRQAEKVLVWIATALALARSAP
jgi:very-short-patch-repair endonuclease